MGKKSWGTCGPLYNPQAASHSKTPCGTEWMPCNKSVYFNATILDPRYKLKPIEDHSNFESMRMKFMMEAEKYGNVEETR